MKIAKILGIIIFLLFCQKAFACSCGSEWEFNQEEFNDLNAVFIGQVVDQYQDTNIHESIIKYKVLKQYKGKAKEGFIYAINTSSNCRKYVQHLWISLLFLYGDDDWNYINSCSREVDIQNINSFSPPSWLSNCLNKSDGRHKSYYSNGNLASDGGFRNNLPDGHWKYFYPWGKLSSRGYYKNGQKEGVWESEETSFTKDTVTYKRGVKHGKSIEYYENGQVSMVEYYVNGNLHGRSETWYDEPYAIEWEASYKQGELLEETYYFENGNKEVYRSDSLRLQWYESGIKKNEVELFEGDKKFEKCWWQNGRLKQFKTFTHSVHGYVIYAAKENGEIMVENGTGYYDMYKKQGYYQDTLKIGVWREELHNGNIVEKTYQKGVEHGPYKRWYKDGQLIFEGAYKEGKNAGLWRFFYNDGQRKLEVDFSSGERILLNSWKPDGTYMVKDGEGIHQYYDTDGKLSKWSNKTTYKNGKRIE